MTKKTTNTYTKKKMKKKKKPEDKTIATRVEKENNTVTTRNTMTPTK